MRNRWWHNGVLLAAVMAFFSIGPFVYSNQSVIFQMMMYMVLAQGINILYGFTGYLPFGYVGFFGTGAYGAAIAIQILHVPALFALVVGGLSALALGAVLSPLLRLSGAYFAIGSLAASQIVYYVVSNPAMTALTNGPYGVQLIQSYHPVASYIAMLVTLALATGAVMYLRGSRFGMALLAVREDPVSAEAAGINVVRAKAYAWFGSAFIAGLAGAAFAWHVSVFYPATVFDLGISVFAIVFTLFGGGATVLGPTIGVILLYGMYNVIGISSPQYFQLIYGALIVGLVLFLPQGLASVFSRRGIHVP